MTWWITLVVLLVAAFCHWVVLSGREQIRAEARRLGFGNDEKAFMKWYAENRGKRRDDS